MPVLSIRSLRKSFRFGSRDSVQRREALRGVDLDVGQGEILGIVGERDSGKTTLLLCAAGLLRCDSGSIHWYGNRFTEGRHLPGVMYVPAVPTYYPFLTVRDVLARHARRDGIHFCTVRTIEDVSQRLLLTGRLATPVAALGTDELKRLAIAHAMMEESKLIVLDGTLDALREGASLVRRAIEDEATRGSTLIIASRQVGVVARTATRIVVMDAGRVAASFSAEPEIHESSTRSIAFTAVGASARQIAERVH